MKFSPKVCPQNDMMLKTTYVLSRLEWLTVWAVLWEGMREFSFLNMPQHSAKKITKEGRGYILNSMRSKNVHRNKVITSSDSFHYFFVIVNHTSYIRWRHSKNPVFREQYQIWNALSYTTAVTFWYSGLTSLKIIIIIEPNHLKFVFI